MNDLADDLKAALDNCRLGDGWERDVPLAAGFTPGGRRRTLRVDLAHLGLRIACECDGGIWGGKTRVRVIEGCVTFDKPVGGHNRGEQIERDCLKSQELALCGYLFCRFTAKDIKNGRAVDVLERLMRKGTK